MNKKFLSALSLSLAAGAFVVTAPLVADAATPSFTDLKTNLDHYSAIMNLADRGILEGFEDGTFRPGAELTRAHASKILALSLDLDIINAPDPGFKDLNKDQWYYGYVAALAHADIISGFQEDNSFRPNEPMTRAHMAKMIDLGYKLKHDPSQSNMFTDVNPASWYNDHIKALVSNSVTKGTSLYTFEPTAHVTRAQMASFVVRGENVERAKQYVTELETSIQKFVAEHEVIEIDGNVVMEAKFLADINRFIVKAYNVDDKLNGLHDLGLVESLAKFGIKKVRISSEKDVALTGDLIIAKEELHQWMLSILTPRSDLSQGNLAATDYVVRLYGEKDGVEFWQEFVLYLHVFHE